MAKKKANGTPRQEEMPGVSMAIKEIEDAALDYAEGRDERMQATEREVELKTALITAMHKHEKTEYKRGRISVELKVEKEKVKVRIKDEEVSVDVAADKKDEAVQ